MFNKQLGPTRPIAPLTEEEKARLRELVTKHAPHLRRKQFTTLEDKLHVRSHPLTRKLKATTLMQIQVMHSSPYCFSASRKGKLHTSSHEAERRISAAQPNLKPTLQAFHLWSGAIILLQLQLADPICTQLASVAELKKARQGLGDFPFSMKYLSRPDGVCSSCRRSIPTRRSQRPSSSCCGYSLRHHLDPPSGWCVLKPSIHAILEKEVEIVLHVYILAYAAMLMCCRNVRPEPHYTMFP